MKKLLLLLLGVLIPATVFGYTIQPGDTLSFIAQRFHTTVEDLAFINGIENPNLIYAGDEIDTGTPNEQVLGSNPLPTDGYDTYLTAPAGASDATIYVNVLPRGITDSIYTIFASDRRTIREKIYCSGVTSTPSNALTGCSRGLATSTSSGVIDETAGTGLTHSTNARIAITDNINFTGKVLAIINGSQNSSSTLFRFGRGVNENINFCFMKGSTTSTSPCITWNGSQFGWNDGSGNSYVFVTTSGDGLAASTTKGVFVTDNLIGINASTTQGMAFGVDGKLYQKTSSTRGISADTNGIMLNVTGGELTFSSTGSLQTNISATSTPTASTIIKSTASGTIHGGWSKLYGDGSDGALTITSGTTTISLALEELVEKNYTSLTIGGTGALNFSNVSTTGAVIIMRVRGDCNVTSTNNPAIQLVSVGGTGGTSGGTPGRGPTQVGLFNGQFTTYGKASMTRGDWVTSTQFYSFTTSSFNSLSLRMLQGAGGGSGTNGSGGVSGVGGNGAGALLILCGGKINFTSTIAAYGTNGTDGANGGGNGGGGGAGGGSGGHFIMMGEELIANTGFVTTTGGSGGLGGGGGGPTGGAGGGGGSHYTAGTIGGAVTNNGGVGGIGGNGWSFIGLNKWFF